MRRISLSLVGPVVLAFIGLGWMFDNIYQHYWGPSSVATPSESQQLFTALASTLDQARSPTEWLAHWPSGSQFNVRLVSLQDIALPVELISKLEEGEVLELETASGRNAMVYLPSHSSLLVMDLPNLTNRAEIQWVRVGFTTVFYVLLGMILMLWLIPLLRRISQLELAAKRFGKGDLATRVRPHKRSYIYSLEQTFNAMARQIEELLADVKLLSSAVSHDLRTPLAKIRLGLEIMAEEQSFEKRHAYEQRLQHHVDEMVSLVEALMDYARMDQALQSLPKYPVNIETLITNICGGLEPKKDVRYNIDPLRVYVMGSSDYLQRALGNVIENAMKYGKGTVQINVKRELAQIHIIIEDNGEGIDENESTDIFKPFTRGQSNTKRDGFGLGLAFVQRVIEWHAGCIRVSQSRQLGGARFDISLPAIGNS